MLTPGGTSNISDHLYEGMSYFLVKLLFSSLDMLHLHSLLAHDGTENGLIIVITCPGLSKRRTNDSTYCPQSNVLAAADWVHLKWASSYATIRCQMFCYHVAVKSCCFVLLVEIRFAVVVIRIPSPSVVRIVPPFLQREFLILHT